MSSLRLVIECQQRGLLSKEAAEGVLEKRNELIKVAMRKQAAALVGAILGLEVGETKEAAGGFLGLRGKGGGGFLSNLKSGGVSRGGGWGDVLGNLSKMVALAGLTAGATTGVSALIHHSRDKKLRGRIQDSYAQMINEFPELKEHLDDPDQKKIVERNFGILSEVAPSIAAIPVVAGTWVRGAMVHKVIDPTDIGKLADTQRKIDEMYQAHRQGGPSLAPLQLPNLITSAMASGGGGGHSGGQSSTP